jgi:hypothetical protein
MVRKRSKEKAMVLNVYVPKKGSGLETTIKRGSAIVGMPVDDPVAMDEWRGDVPL